MLPWECGLSGILFFLPARVEIIMAYYFHTPFSGDY